MPRIVRDLNQPGVYYFRETEEEKNARLEKEDLIMRIESLERELGKAGYKPPAPIEGFQRKRIIDEPR